MRSASVQRCVLVVLVVCLAMCGCAWQRVNVTLDSSFAGDLGELPTVEVHVLGLNKSELPVYEQCSMTEYWKPGSRMAAATDIYKMKFGEGLPTRQTLHRGSRNCKEWQRKNARYLFVAAFLPGTYEDRTGNADPRRIILPYEDKYWDNAEEIDIVIKPGSGVSCLTPHKPMDR